jgi:hypothetical protein
MATLAQDRQFLKAGVSELQDYLSSNELYATLSGPFTLPRLTLGGLLLARQRLGTEADLLAAQIEEIHSKRRAAWDEKVRREVHARNELWRNYLLDYDESPKTYRDEYPEQVRFRAMLVLLGEESNRFDEKLKGIFIPGGFVWEKECAERFPQDTFWFLFGKLK